MQLTQSVLTQMSQGATLGMLPRDTINRPASAGQCGSFSFAPSPEGRHAPPVQHLSGNALLVRTVGFQQRVPQHILNTLAQVS